MENTSRHSNMEVVRKGVKRELILDKSKLVEIDKQNLLCTNIDHILRDRIVNQKEKTQKNQLNFSKTHTLLNQIIILIIQATEY